MSTFNGIGYKFYGHKKLTKLQLHQYGVSSNSYITTEWFVFLSIPIFPLNSYIVVGETNKGSDYYGVYFSERKEFQTIKLEKIDKEQVIFTYLLSLLVPVLIILYTIGNSYFYQKNKVLGLIIFNVALIFSIIVYFLVISKINRKL